MSSFGPLSHGGVHAAALKLWYGIDPGVREYLALGVALGGLSLFLVLWVLLFHKRGGRRSRRGSASGSRSRRSRRSEAAGPGEPHRQHKSRRRRRQAQPRNPTLAETGGLPGLGADEPPEAAF